MNVSLDLALKGMRARPRQFVICVLGVFLGVVALTVIMSVSNGFEKALVASILETSGHLALSSREHRIGGWEALRQDLLREPAVEAAAPSILGQCIVERGQTFSGVNLRGVEPAWESGISGMASKMTTGAFAFGGSNEAVLGAALASQLGVRVGELVTVVCPDGENYKLTVVGLYETGVVQFDLQTVFVPLRLAQRALGFGDDVSHVLLRVREPLRAQEVADDLQRRLGFEATSWLETHKVLLSALSMEKRVMFLVLVLMLVVAGFGISNVLTMIVYEKYRDIGILRALGATRRSVVALFLGQGFAVGAAGTVLGVLGSLGAGWLLDRYPIPLPGRIYYVDRVPFEFQTPDFVLVAVTACLVATLAGVLPARRAVAIHPWEAIRYYQ